MMRFSRIFIIFVVFFLISGNLFGSDNTTSKTEDDVILDEKTGFPIILNKPFPVFDYGVTSSWVTRIMKQTGRSNFVFDDFLLGVYCNMQTKNMAPLDSVVRLAVYYPLLSKFNDVEQPPVNFIHFAIDLFAAPVFNLSFWNYVTFDLGAGLHFLYQQSDRWDYINLGLGGLARVNMPVTRRWTFFMDGIASLDYGNLGTNSKMENYDVVWQYQLSVGIRYSKRGPNKYSYIPSKRTYEEEIQALNEEKRLKQAKKEARNQERLEKKAKKAAEAEAAAKARAAEKAAKEAEEEARKAAESAQAKESK